MGEFFVANDRSKNLSSFCTVVVAPASSPLASSVIALKSHNFMLQSKDPENKIVINAVLKIFNYANKLSCWKNYRQNRKPIELPDDKMVPSRLKANA